MSTLTSVPYLLLLLSCFSHVQLYATLWTVAHQAPLVQGILQARILEWVAVPSSRESSQPGIEPTSLMSTSISRQVLYRQCHLGSPSVRVSAVNRIGYYYYFPTGLTQSVKNLPAMQETWVQFLGREDSPGEGNGNPVHCSCLENPMEEEPGGLQSMGSQEPDTTE